MNSSNEKKHWLSYANLSDTYERKARFAPALLSVVMLIPAALAFGIPLWDWVKVVVAGVGVGAVIALGLSHLASALGNRVQRQLWPRWPHDAPTHLWLNPDDSSRSGQQKKQWYAAIESLTGLQVKGRKKGDSVEAVINDAVSQLRNRLWKSDVAERLAMHNADFGFARNLCGLRVVWIPATAIGALACWAGVYFMEINIGWAIAATIVSILALLLGTLVLPAFVRQKAEHYADSFFAAVLALNSQQTEEAAEES